MSDPVRYVLDLNALPPLTEAQKVELHALSQMPDGDIDCSDIPRSMRRSGRTPCPTRSSCLTDAL